MGLPKRKVVFQPPIFRGYVSFREGTQLGNIQPEKCKQINAGIQTVVLFFLVIEEFCDRTNCDEKHNLVPMILEPYLLVFLWNIKLEQLLNSGRIFWFQWFPMVFFCVLIFANENATNSSAWNIRRIIIYTKTFLIAQTYESCPGKIMFVTIGVVKQVQ